MKLGGIDFSNEEEKGFFMGVLNTATPSIDPPPTSPSKDANRNNNNNNSNNNNNNNEENINEARSKIVGKKVVMRVVAVGLSDKAMAVQVEGVDEMSEVPMRTRNRIPHITVAVSPIGKPKDSNTIEQWEDVKNDPNKSILLVVCIQYLDHIAR